jgi:hypothetical protein
MKMVGHQAKGCNIQIRTYQRFLDFGRLRRRHSEEVL